MSTLGKFDARAGATAVIVVGVVVLMYLAYTRNLKLRRLVNLREAELARWRREQMMTNASGSDSTTEVEVEEADDEESEEAEAEGN